ncbi:MAG TPA: tetratricopeptide repeat protein [Chitinophagales bacterium]|nr:tetratricopeptide repeat protein [Chitinophagales bacterium]
MKKMICFICVLLFLAFHSFNTKAGQIDSLKLVLQQSHADTSQVNVLNKISRLSLYSNPDDASRDANEALTLSKKLGFRTGESAALNNLGVFNSTQGQYDQALDYFKQSYAIDEELNHKKDMASKLNNIAIINDLQGNYPVALDYYLRALKLSEEIGFQNQVIGCYSNIGILYSNMKQYANSIKYYMLALNATEAAKDTAEIINALHGIGDVYERENKIDSAEIVFARALNLSKESHDEFHLGISLNNLGNVYRDEKKFPEAISYFTQALPVFTALGDQENITMVEVNYGQTLAESGNTGEGLKHLENARAIAEEIGHRNYLSQSNKALAEVYAKANDFQKAYHHYVEYAALKDSMVNEESTRQVAQMQTIYETGKKDKQIALASANANRQVVIRNFSIVIAVLIVLLGFVIVQVLLRKKKSDFEKQIQDVEMKALRAQMNPHFIFNALDNINAFVEANDKASASDYLIKFARLIRLILENSRQQEVLLEKDVETLRLYLDLEALRFSNKFEYKLNISSDIDEENTLIPPMILQPFVENAILHGLQPKEEKGTLEIFLRKENDQLVCIVEDNGVGRSRSVEINTKKAHKSESLGMKITKERLDILSRLRRVKTGINIVDLFDEKNFAAGTRVEVLLPLRIAV